VTSSTGDAFHRTLNNYSYAFTMRLLEQRPDGELALHEFTDKNVPAYAILSHMWNANDKQEVTLQDVEVGTGKNKAGYRKMQFCAKQAAEDGLRYFWIDTCCIDKRNAVELAEAINSMFRWYQNAAKCYVYMSDVSTLSGSSWHSDFQESRWFKRGWTLQELLAPGLVEFFSRESTRLGDKTTLELQIHDITSIPVSALRCAPLSQYTIDERLSWALHRQTTRDEDQAYSLLGLFSVYIPLIYGEGRENAFRRLREEIDKPANGKHITPNLHGKVSAVEPPIGGLSERLLLSDNLLTSRMFNDRGPAQYS
jgi:Heterokaryon incompatibility protein (HET)